MSTVSAVVLGTIFMPLLGMPDVYEVHAFHEVMSSWSAAHAAQRDDEAARLRSAEVVMPAEPEAEGGWWRLADRQPEIRRADASPSQGEVLTAAVDADAAIEPLPVDDEATDSPVIDIETDLADSEETVPGIEPEEFEPLPEIEEPNAVEVPILDEKG